MPDVGAILPLPVGPNDHLGDAALAYARAGIPVHPLIPRTKRPMLTGWNERATTDLAQVDEWWGCHPDANIGLVTGAVFDVLDVDGEEGERQLKRAGDAAGFDGEWQTVVLTPSGGWHVWLHPLGRGNRAGFRPGLDWRGVGGYVVAPPSIHPNGRRYLWAGGRPDDDLQKAPRWLLELLDGVVALETRRRTVAPVQTGKRGPFVTAALRSEIETVRTAPRGQRNDTLNRAAYNLGQLVGAGVLDFQEAGDLLFSAGLEAGLSEHEAQATTLSGLRSGQLNPRRLG